MKGGADVIAASSGSVYYSGNYWNDFVAVRAILNRRATGEEQLEWYNYFFKQHPGPYKKVLMLNCGNGWLERKMHKRGYITELVGVDYSDELLDEARKKAGKLPFRYYHMDINTGSFPEADFDLVINHAAAHHIAKLNKVFRRLLEITTNDALFVNYDYVGPHRNQYSMQQWHAASKLNKLLPETCQQALGYPHLPTMLVTDPSEAVHAELILETMGRYFTVDAFRPLGGALAYLLLTHNEAIQNAPKRTVARALKTIMDADETYLAEHPESTMFAYWVAKPDKAVLRQTALLNTWQQAEDEREKNAVQAKGHYYDLEPIQELFLELDSLRITKQHKQSTIEELQQHNDALQSELEAIQSSTSWKIARLLARAKAALPLPGRSPES